jgi:hypothetical protein
MSRSDFDFGIGCDQQRIDERCMRVRGISIRVNVGVRFYAVLVNRSFFTVIVVVARMPMARRGLHHVVGVVHQGHCTREKRREQVEDGHRNGCESH